MKKTLPYIILISSIFWFSCQTVKPYQKSYLNDEEMNLANRKIEFLENNFQTYREGAAGGLMGNSGSGCGCN